MTTISQAIPFVALTAGTFALGATVGFTDPPNVDRQLPFASALAIGGTLLAGLGAIGMGLPMVSARTTMVAGLVSAALGYGFLIGGEFGKGEFQPPPPEILL